MELALGCWLLASPFVFAHGAERTLLWANDLAAAAAMIAIALATYWRRLRRLHLLQLAVAGWLVALGWWHARGGVDAPAAAQNWIVVGLMLAMLAIVPSRASTPPAGWRPRAPSHGGRL